MDEEELKKFNVENFKKQFEKKVEYSGNLCNGEGYQYIAKLLLRPVKDGRHRILWLVIAPYVANILKLTREQALNAVQSYLKLCNELQPTDTIESIVYYVDYAKQQGLKPPHLDRIKDTDPDLWAIIVGAIGE
jgi:hypothetical protein